VKDQELYPAVRCIFFAPQWYQPDPFAQAKKDAAAIRAKQHQTGKYE
jgi:hypothetical protein